MLTNLSIALLLLALVGAVLWALLRRGSATAGPDGLTEEHLDTVVAWPPQATRILTTDERVAYITLLRALPGHMILAQVPLSRFLKVPKRHSYTEWLRRLGNHCVDLVVCDMASQIVAVIDIQPPPAAANDRLQRRAARIARTLEAAGVTLHVWTEGALPSVEQARDIVLPKPPALRSERPPEAVPPAVDASDVARPQPAATSPFDDSARDSTQDEVIELHEPRPSTWFDELDSAPAPLQRPTTKR